MKFQPTPLSGAYVIDLEPFEDERGLFARTYCEREFKALGLDQPFVQINHSVNTKKGTIRGLHFQKKPHAEIKLIRCIKGAVFDVLVDVRPDSKTFLQHFALELNERNKKMIYIPEGFAHGFQTLEDGTELIYHHTAFYTPAAECGLKYNDPRLNIKWPFPATLISEKDQNNDSIAELIARV